MLMAVVKSADEFPHTMQRIKARKKLVVNMPVHLCRIYPRFRSFCSWLTISSALHLSPPVQVKSHPLNRGVEQEEGEKMEMGTQHKHGGSWLVLDDGGGRIITVAKKNSPTNH